MSDLFAEAHAERSAIMEHDAGLPRDLAERLAEADTRKALHACEVRSVVKMFREQGKKGVVAFLADVEEKRGKAARERLEADALAALGKA